jgi:hypothetical protein
VRGRVETRNHQTFKKGQCIGWSSRKARMGRLKGGCYKKIMLGDILAAGTEMVELV